MDKKAVTIVLDGVGVGALPDAGLYGDESSDSVSNTARAVGGLRLPTMERLGLGRVTGAEGLRSVDDPAFSWGRMAELSPGKDSTSGHWELMGCPLKEPFPTYPKGFPSEIVGRFEERTGLGILGNRPASGTEIIEELGGKHMQTGRPIVYTSADSVFQVAAHEDVIPPLELYRICEAAREILVGRHNVARVIARPFEGKPGGFVRTPRRRDFSLPPPAPTLLDRLSGRGRRVVTVGKIHDLFAGRGIDQVMEAGGNAEAMRLAADVLDGDADFSFLFVNLIDFDMLWGHRRNAGSYAAALEEFDSWLDGFLEGLQRGTLFCITSDHGCDPTMPGSDHTREYVPILAGFAGSEHGSELGTRKTFSDLAATVSVHLGLEPGFGESFHEVLA